MSESSSLNVPRADALALDRRNLYYRLRLQPRLLPPFRAMDMPRPGGASARASSLGKSLTTPGIR